MNPLFQRLMQKATLLTRKGDLRAATAAIQAALADRPQPEAPPRDGRHEVIDVQAREWAADAAADPAPDAPDAATADGSFIAGSHAGLVGTRAYKLYIPPQAAQGKPLPLIVMLHGCKQDPDDFALGTRMNEAARAHGFYVLYPAQSQRANPQRCWNWFKHNHQERGRGEPELLAGMALAVMAQHAVDPAQVFVAGLSAGGAMAAILGETYPDVFAAVGVHSGLAAGAVKDLSSAFDAMRHGAAPRRGSPSGVPTIVFHGDTDQTVHPGNGAHVVTAAAGPGTADAERSRAPGGRAYTRHVYRTDSGTVVEHWVVHGSGHAWSGGSPRGSYTDPQGPDATRELVRFFMHAAKRPNPG